MGIPANIKTLLSGTVVEWARIELKESWDAEASLKTICAFANDIDNWGGGYIILGAKSWGEDTIPTLEGLPAELIDRIQRDILNKCKLIQPEYLPVVEAVHYKEKNFLVIWVPGGNSRPYSAPKYMSKENKERAYYIRKMSSTVRPSDDELRDLFTLSNNIPFDDRVNHAADIRDLNVTLIQSYLKEIDSSLYEDSKEMDFIELCKNMNIVSTLPEYVKPKNVGLMFFSFEPDKFFPYAQIDVVEFPEDLGGDEIIEKIFKGPLHIQLREAILYINNRIIQEKVIKQPDVPEARRFFNYPIAAVEEAVANAVYHKGYDEREPIEIRIMPDRIEIVSHPGADRSVSMDNLKNFEVFSRRYRNRRIGDFLKEMRLTEGRNTGFRKIVSALRQNGSPDPLFRTDEERLYFAVTIYKHPDFINGKREVIKTADDNHDSIGESIGVNGSSIGANIGVNGSSVGVNIGANGSSIGVNGSSTDKNIGTNSDNIDLNETQRHILQSLYYNPRMTAQQLSNQVGISKRNIEANIKHLKANGHLERIGAAKNGYWKVNTDVTKQGVGDDL